MSFTVLPAVDVAHGRVARTAGTASDDPLERALALQAAGASWIHLVDLDAAFGHGTNAGVLAEIVRTVEVDVELAGGIVDDVSLARALATGCARVLIGGAASANPEWCARVIAEHGERVAVSLDVQVVHRDDGSTEHRIAPRGTSVAGGDLWEAIARLDGAGCARYAVTNVGRDGTLAGPDLDLVRAAARATSACVIASGGVASIQDLRRLAEAATGIANLEGVIVGTALATGRFTLPEALAALRPLGSAGNASPRPEPPGTRPRSAG